MKRIINPIKTTEVDSINEYTIRGFINQKVLIETSESSKIGVLNKFKGNYALFNNDSVIASIKINEIVKISGKNKLSNLFETITKCGSGYCVKSKKGKNLGGPYTKEGAEKRLRQVEYFKHHDVHENVDLLLKERLINRFFKINEEIVNSKNIGKLTPQSSNPRAKNRDKIAKSSRNHAKPLAGTGDTEEEAKYRYATYIELRKDDESKKSKKKRNK